MSQRLYQQVFAPLRAALGPATLIYLAPDGELNRLAFEALVDDRGEYLVESYRFAYLSSGRDLLRPASEPGRGRSCSPAPTTTWGPPAATSRPGPAGRHAAGAVPGPAWAVRATCGRRR